MKHIFSLILLFSLSLNVFAADADWKLHPIFDENVAHVIETPDYVYFTSLNMEENKYNKTYSSLFRYDKNGEELIALSPANILNHNSIRDVIYNPAKGYLAILYKDFEIDLLYNNGSVVNIPYYALADLTFPKDVNSITLDTKNNRFYLATSFGYVAINDKKNEVAESKIYGEPLQAFCRMGNHYLAIKGNELIYAPVSDPRLSLDDYKLLASFDKPLSLHPLSDNIALIISGDANKKYVRKLSFDGSSVKTEDVVSGTIYNIENNAKGVQIVTGDVIYQFAADGNFSSLNRPEGYNNSAAASSNMSEVWNGLKRKGLSSVKKSGESWKVTRDWMLPNAPATYVTTSFASHPTLGFFLLSNGYTPVTHTLNSHASLQLSAYKDGKWKNYAPAYTNPSRASVISASNGLVFDPDKSNYAYISSYHNGILRLNLENPQDILHLSREKDSDKNNPGFAVLPPSQNSNSGYWNIGAPNFDNAGNLWMYFANWDDTGKPYFYCWLAADRKASTSAANVQLPKVISFNVEASTSNQGQAIPLLKTGDGLLVFSPSQYNEELMLIDTKGTPTVSSDDKIYKFRSFTDSDGNSVDLQYVKYLWEDPSTGYVWICHGYGVCYFVPSKVLAGDYSLNRVKVARNDGTNLADYLLEGVIVNQMTRDADGRKWFATGGGGIICTSADGREIIAEYNSANSLLPDDTVYGIGYNAETNSLIASTAQGYVEFSLPKSINLDDKPAIKAFPNPVRPEYSGYVTITDIPQGSFVKITDSFGNLVKELGVMSGFEILWDISDSNYNRVKSGVYHIMVSPSDESSKYSAVGKILVIS